MIFLDLLFCKAQMKQNALTDARHSDEEIGRPLAEIDEDIRKTEACSVRNRRHAPPCLHRRQPPRLRHPHRADGLHGAGGGDGVRGGVMSHLISQACRL